MLRSLKVANFLRQYQNLPKQAFALSHPPLYTNFAFQLSSYSFKPSFTMSTQASLHKNILKSSYQGKGYYLEQLFTGCLAIYSYYLESGDDCFLVDPLFDIHEYNQIIKSRGKTLKGIFISHYHADYLSGQYQLAKKHKCQIYMGPKSIPSETVVSLKDKETINLGKIKLECWHTPGHTEESSCLVVVDDKGKSDVIFTGDTIFLNEVGRPDLAVKTNLSAADLASMLFDSLQKIKQLNGDIKIYPGHGSGSACGKSIGKGDFCTLETQKNNNYGLKATDRSQFIRSVLEDMPNPPQYFGYNAKINKFEPHFFQEASKKALKQLNPSEVNELAKEKDVTVIDIRSTDGLKGGIISGSICIGFDGGFANWVGTLLDPLSRFIIYGGTQQQATQAIKRLYRIGFINIIGHASFPINSWKTHGYKTIEPDFVFELPQPETIILDVRKQGEWKEHGVVEGAVRVQLSDLFKHPEKIEKSKTYVIHCGSGYRSKIAYSYLTSLGYKVKSYPLPYTTIAQNPKIKKVKL